MFIITVVITATCTIELIAVATALCIKNDVGADDNERIENKNVIAKVMMHKK